MSHKKTGRFAILEQFLADGITHMFGNPGTVEQGFLDALDSYPDFRYILTLQESVAVMMADGYARATQRPALVQLHSTPGVGNAVGALYQAKRGHSPLVVIGGDAGIRYQAMDSQMAGDLVAMMEPVTKWSAMVMDASSLLRMVRRAIKIASTPPMGPVYLCLPMDILDAEVVEEVQPTVVLNTRTVPDAGWLQEAATHLAASKKPIFFVGDGIAYSQAQDELTRVAELIGAEVYEADAGEVNMAYAHPLYCGMTGHMFGYASKPITSRGDVNFVCGTYMLPEVFPVLEDIYADGAKVIHVDLNAYEIGKNHRVDLSAVSNPKTTLAQLAEVLESHMTPQQKDAARKRTEEIGNAKQQKREADLKNDESVRGTSPLHMSQFMQALAPHLSQDTIIFDEALTNSPAITRHHPPAKTGCYFLTRGGSLGVGIPGALGAQLANPDKPVFGFTGDGGCMYTIQALWTAARHNINAKLVVCNNASYRLLQLNIGAYWKERNIPAHDFPLCFDLSRPVLRFDEMARSMGVDAVRAEKPEEIGPAIEKALATPGPFLIDLVLEADVHPELIGVKCGQ